MPISFQCPACAKSLKAKEESAGKRIKCPACEETIPVPAVSTRAVASKPSRPPAKSPAMRRNAPSLLTRLRKNFGTAARHLGRRVRGLAFDWLVAPWKNIGFEKGRFPENREFRKLLCAAVEAPVHGNTPLDSLIWRPHVTNARLVDYQWLAAKSLQELLANAVIPTNYCFRCGAENPSEQVDVSVFGHCVRNLFDLGAPYLEFDSQIPNLRLPLCCKCAEQQHPNWDICYLSAPTHNHPQHPSNVRYYLMRFYVHHGDRRRINDFERAFWRANWNMAVAPFAIESSPRTVAGKNFFP